MPLAPSRSTTDSSHGPTVFVVCRSWTSTRHRRSTTPTTISVFATGLSQPVMKGSGEALTPGSGAALEPGEFILGCPDEDGLVANLPDEVLSRNGNYLPYPRLEEHVALFRVYLHENSEAPDDEELRAAKFMGRGAVVRRWCWYGTRMTRNSAQIHAQQRLQLQGDGSVRLCGPARLSRPSAESARHGALHESSANDPAPARGMGRHSPSPLPTMGWIAASPCSSSARTSFDGSSSRRTCGSMTRRFASWAGLHCSEAADPHDTQGTSSIHDPQTVAIFSSYPG